MYNYLVIKIFLVKHKRILSITLAVLLLVALFLIKNTTLFQNKKTTNEVAQTNGLIYGDMTVGDLVNKDTDGDGIPDWEEPLYGLDPTKKETVPGTPDSTTINKLKGEQGLSLDTTKTQNTENLTETEKFSRELFSTVTALTQNGAMDQTTVDQISGSLSERIKNSTPRKIYTMADIKIIADNTALSVQKYKNTLISIYKKYPPVAQVDDVLTKFVGDGTTVNESALAELTPIIKQMQKFVEAWAKTAVPVQLAQQHLDVINGFERIIENINDMQFYNSDPIVVIGAVKNYQKNIPLLQSALDAHANAVNQKLKS